MEREAADFDTARLNECANIATRLEREGICMHGHVMAPDHGQATCLNCRKTWLNSSAMWAEQDELRARYF